MSPAGTWRPSSRGAIIVPAKVVTYLRTAISHLLTLQEPSGVILLCTNTGGSIAICVAADDPSLSAAGRLSPAPTSMTAPTTHFASSNTLARSGRSTPRLPAFGGGVDP